VISRSPVEPASAGLSPRAKLLPRSLWPIHRFPGLAQHPLVPQNPPPGHRKSNAEPLRDGAVGQPLLAQLVGARVEIGAALAGHGQCETRSHTTSAAGVMAPRRNEIALMVMRELVSTRITQTGT
jgi:hypothetical protein